jgi:ADP-ribosylglycohydrolase
VSIRIRGLLVFSYFSLFSPDSHFTDDSVLTIAVSLGGDSDTLACITGGIAEAFYGPIPQSIQEKVQDILPPELRGITDKFCAEHTADLLEAFSGAGGKWELHSCPSPQGP